MPRALTRGPRWSREHDTLLCKLWGELSPGELAEQFGRSRIAVVIRARRLQLGSALRGSTSLGEFVRETGYARSRVMNAAKRLHLKIRRAPQVSERKRTTRGKRSMRILLSDEQQDAILAFLRTIPDGRNVLSNRTKKTQRTAWGTGGKPPACITCATTERPHKSAGRCTLCYSRWYEQKRGKRDRSSRKKRRRGKQVSRVRARVA